MHAGKLWKYAHNVSKQYEVETEMNNRRKSWFSVSYYEILQCKEQSKHGVKN